MGLFEVILSVVPDYLNTSFQFEMPLLVTHRNQWWRLAGQLDTHHRGIHEERSTQIFGDLQS